MVAKQLALKRLSAVVAKNFMITYISSEGPTYETTVYIASVQFGIGVRVIGPWISNGIFATKAKNVRFRDVSGLRHCMNQGSKLEKSLCYSLTVMDLRHPLMWPSSSTAFTCAPACVRVFLYVRVCLCLCACARVCVRERVRMCEVPHLSVRAPVYSCVSGCVL